MATVDTKLPPSALGYLDTMRRWPDRIVLAVATRDMNMLSHRSCLCAWAVRETVAGMVRLSADDVQVDSPVTARLAPVGSGAVFSDDVPAQCVSLFGGTYGEWHDVYSGVTYDVYAADVELAFVARVDEAVARARDAHA